jgi:HPt (histidine-containing phosphotransfer) domain-containing protein
MAVRPAKSTYKSEPILEVSALRELAEDTGTEGLPRLTQMFNREMEKRAAQLLKSRDQQDVTLLMKTCHAIAGSSGTIGGRRLQKLASSIERACSKNAEPKYLVLIDTVIQEIDQLSAEISKVDFSSLNTAKRTDAA